MHSTHATRPPYCHRTLLNACMHAKHHRPTLLMAALDAKLRLHPPTLLMALRLMPNRASTSFMRGSLRFMFNPRRSPMSLVDTPLGPAGCKHARLLVL